MLRETGPPDRIARLRSMAQRREETVDGTGVIDVVVASVFRLAKNRSRMTAPTAAPIVRLISTPPSDCWRKVGAIDVPCVPAAECGHSPRQMRGVPASGTKLGTNSDPQISQMFKPDISQPARGPVGLSATISESPTVACADSIVRRPGATAQRPGARPPRDPSSSLRR